MEAISTTCTRYIGISSNPSTTFDQKQKIPFPLSIFTGAKNMSPHLSWKVMEAQQWRMICFRFHNKQTCWNASKNPPSLKQFRWNLELQVWQADDNLNKDEAVQACKSHDRRTVRVRGRFMSWAGCCSCDIPCAIVVLLVSLLEWQSSCIGIGMALRWVGLSTQWDVSNWNRTEMMIDFNHIGQCVLPRLRSY